MLLTMTNGHSCALRRWSLMAALAAVPAFSACTGKSPDSCPSYLVQLDAGALEVDAGDLDAGPNTSDDGIGGFSSVGEW